ncbi:hypothetical protein DAEQUDRAFT_765556 [Daedalea quercina L-15889]|uniref:Family A G protein-coupled receptor-like protein n=1 Tax=Daedalea quercina L-15889 TaxID=1314783 RepID=A0A165QB19_9APHY|nr:hypothetical protein DAEQUDRAFT_765556 [Daedalea quercina L-15889]
MSPISVVSANLAIAPLESLLYGIFLVLWGTSVYFHLTHPAIQRASVGRSALSKYMTPIFCASTIVMCTVTGHWILTVCRLFDAFLNFEQGAAPSSYYGDLAITTEVVQTALLEATIIACDIVIIYRLWIVWGFNYYTIAIPSCCVVGLCVTGPTIVYSFIQLKTGNPTNAESLSRWIAAGYSCTFATNIYCSSGIAWRVWRARRTVPPYEGRNLTRVLVTIVESAAIYTTAATFYFGCYQASSDIQYTAIDLQCAMAGIALMMINVRVGLGWAEQAPHSASPGTASRQPESNTHEEQPYPMCSLVIDVSKVVHTHDDRGESIRTKSSELPV